MGKGGRADIRSQKQLSSSKPADTSTEWKSSYNPLDPNAPNAWESGDLDKMFARLKSGYGHVLTVLVDGCGRAVNQSRRDLRHWSQLAEYDA